MQMCIENDSRVEDIQKLFSACYPFLKIEFCKLSVYTATNKKESIPLNMCLAQAINKNLKAAINIDKTITVAEVEESFLKLGIKAEILRRLGNVWVETLLTSNWTLDQQNREGEEISRPYIAG